MKVVLDCNVIASFLITPGNNIKIIRNAWNNDKFELIMSDEIFEEIEQILERLVKQGYFNDDQSTELSKTILRKSTFINVITKVNICSDKKDNRYLSCAKDSRANYIVTGDKHHLIPIKKYKYTKIITPADFALILSALPSCLN